MHIGLMAQKMRPLKSNQGGKWIPASLGLVCEWAPTIGYVNESGNTEFRG